MSYGLRIVNPAGEIVLDADASGHTYVGNATVTGAQTKFLSQLSPWHLEWVAPDTSVVPMFALRADSASVVAGGGAYRTGSVWTIIVHCVALAGCAGYATLANYTPTVYVFAPGAHADSHGLRLFNSAGGISYDLARPPLGVREVVTFPARAGYLSTAGVPSGDWAAYADGDAVAVTSGLTAAAIVGASTGYRLAQWVDTGEPDIEWGYGWTLSAGQLRRVRFWRSDGRPYASLDDYPAQTDQELHLPACTAYLADPTYLT